MEVRQIKFRAISIEDDNDGWVYGYYTYSSPQGLMDKHWIIDPIGDLIKINPETICQFTGLHDKEGREIYEEDIIEYQTDHFNGNDYEKIMEKSLIKYDEGGFEPLWSMFIMAPSIEELEIKVIGNKFDNPELLKYE